MKTIAVTVLLVAFTYAEPPPSNSYLPPPSSSRGAGYPQGPASQNFGPQIIAARNLDGAQGRAGLGPHAHSGHGAQANGFGRSAQDHGATAHARHGAEEPAGYPNSAARNALEEINSEPANYNFGYMVNDYQEGTDFGHHEERQDERAQGEYHVVLPDGRKQVIVAIIFAIGSVSALGSGPYLPSGWRPSGPSFYLPSEVAKPSEGPVKENLLQETEASASDALREYGPPKVEAVVQYSVNQGLPDEATQQTFFVQSLATQELQAGAGETVAVEVNTESAAIVEEVASTAEAVAEKIEQAEVIAEVQPTLEAVAEVVEQTEAAQAVEATEAALAEIVEPTAAVQEEVVAEEVIPTVVVDEAVPTAVVEQVVVEKVAEGVNNIAEAIVKLETEAKAAEAVESAVEIKQEVSGSLQQAPEGFLEYGPPGFREYGPPKSAAVEAAPENNEVRRRRFSPKFKSHKKH